MKSLVIVYSYHHHNTEKLASTMARVLDAPVRVPSEVRPEELQEYDLVGLGSGIYDETTHPSLLDLLDQTPAATNGKAFIFSTSGIAMASSVDAFHAVLKAKLKAKGYAILGEFNCAGHNSNSFLKMFGGLNKGRPNADDLKRAEEFAENLKQEVSRRSRLETG